MIGNREQTIIRATLAIAKSAEKSLKCSLVLEDGSAELNIPFLSVGASGPVHLNMRLERASIAQLESTPQ